MRRVLHQLKSREFWLFTGSQAVTQALSFVAGLIVIRELSPRSYALYLVVAAVVAAAATVTEAGISTTLLGRLSRTAIPSDEADDWMSAAFRTKRTLAAVVGLPALALLSVVVLLNGASAWSAVALVLLAAVTMLIAFASSIFGVGLQLTGQLSVLRQSDLLGGVVRLVLVSVLTVLAALGALTALLVSLGVVVLQRVVEAFALRERFRFGSTPSPASGAAMRSSVARTLPVSLGTVGGEQLLLLTLSVLGNSEGIAASAALAKYASLFLVLNSVVFTIGSMKLAKADLHRRSGIMWPIISAYGLLAVLYLAFCAVAAPLLSGLLGDSYSALQREFLIINTGVALNNFALFGLGSVNHSMGWVAGGWVYLPALIVVLSIGVLVLPLGTVTGACVLSASLAIPTLVSQVYRLGVGLRTRKAGDQ